MKKIGTIMVAVLCMAVLFSGCADKYAQSNQNDSKVSGKVFIAEKGMDDGLTYKETFVFLEDRGIYWFADEGDKTTDEVARRGTWYLTDEAEFVCQWSRLVTRTLPDSGSAEEAKLAGEEEIREAYREIMFKEDGSITLNENVYKLSDKTVEEVLKDKEAVVSILD